MTLPTIKYGHAVLFIQCYMSMIVLSLSVFLTVINDSEDDEQFDRKFIAVCSSQW